MFDFLEQISEVTKVEVLGVLITKVDERKNYYRQTRESLLGLDDIKVFDTCIHVDSAVEWAQDNSMPVGAYKKNSRCAKEFVKFAEEVIENVNR